MYRALPHQLFPIADGAKRFYHEQWGISENKVSVEQPIKADMGFVTTLNALTKDFHWICVEVSERAYYDSLDRFVLDCKNANLPVKLYVAMPKVESGSFKADLTRARNNGVGVLEISNTQTTVLLEALSLPLTGVRVPDTKEFPSKYRQTIATAIHTFRNGNPAKGCADLYDELEGLSRRIAAKAAKNGYWRGQTPPPPQSLHSMPWARLMKNLISNFDSGSSNSPALTDALFGRVLGVTPHRNDVAHKPANQKDLIKRQSELRTRFENVSDILKDLVIASRSLRV
jgi:hypothetical protein